MAKIIRAKVRCSNIEEQRYPVDGTPTSGQKVSETVTFHGVCGGSEENKVFAKHTPVLHISKTIDNPECFDQYKVGEEYYLDFIPVASLQSFGKTEPEAALQAEPQQ